MKKKKKRKRNRQYEERYRRRKTSKRNLGSATQQQSREEYVRATHPRIRRRWNPGGALLRHIVAAASGDNTHDATRWENRTRLCAWSPWRQPAL